MAGPSLYGDPVASAKARVFRVGYHYSPPNIMREAGTGRPIGLAVDVMREAARRTGIQMEWVWIGTTGADPAFKAHLIDIFPLITITPERQGQIHITAPWRY